MEKATSRRFGDPERMKGWFAKVGKFSQLGPNAMRHSWACVEIRISGGGRKWSSTSIFLPAPPYLSFPPTTRSNRLAGTETNDGEWVERGNTCAVLSFACSVIATHKYSICTACTEVGSSPYVTPPIPPVAADGVPGAQTRSRSSPIIGRCP
jgi:hypothetical protein